MSSLLTSVVSAAVISGDLIIGLSDGSMINCGRVQGPVGLTGDRGPMGATGRSGSDGSTILTVQGTPDTTVGKDGDFAINVSVWEIYGPRAGGAWGTGTPLRGNARGNQSPDTTQNLFGSNSPGSGGGGGGIQQIDGGNGITTTKQSTSVYKVEADIDTDKGLTFEAGKIAIKVEAGLEFDALTGALKATSDARLPYRIETDKVLRDTKDVRSGEAEIQLVDNDDNFSSVKFTGTNGIDVTTDASGINFDGSKLAGDIAADLTNYATTAYVDSEDQNLQNQIDELQVQKGSAAIYNCKNNSSNPYNARAGEIAFNAAVASDVTILGLGTEDTAGRPTKSIQQGDIIEVVGLDGSDTRYKVTDIVGAPVYIGVTFIAGDQGFVLDVPYTVYIYPQNEAGATKEYVDQQDALKLDKVGGTVTGALVADGSVTINGNSEYTGTTGTDNSLVNRKYVDEAVASGGDFVPTTGGTMTGKLKFTTGSIQGGDYGALSSRASLQISCNSDLPVVVETGSSYKSAFQIFGYNASSPDNRLLAIDLKANGGITATGTYSGQLIKSTRNTGYAFEAKPDDIETTALIRTNGSADFTNKLTLLKDDTTDHSGFTIKGTVTGGSEGNLLQSYHNAGTNVDAINYNGKMTEGTNIVNKSYVDSQFRAKPAQLMWRWEGDKGSTTTAPSAKRFLRTESSGTDYLRFSFQSMNNVDLGDALFADTNVSFTYGPIGCIWYQDTLSGKWRLKMQFRCETWRWNYTSGGDAHFEFGFSSRHGKEWNNFTIGADYYVTVGGFF